MWAAAHNVYMYVCTAFPLAPQQIYAVDNLRGDMPASYETQCRNSNDFELEGKGKESVRERKSK